MYTSPQVTRQKFEMTLGRNYVCSNCRNPENHFWRNLFFASGINSDQIIGRLQLSPRKNNIDMPF